MVVNVFGMIVVVGANYLVDYMLDQPIESHA